VNFLKEFQKGQRIKTASGSELEVLEESLEGMIDILSDGGRMRE